MKDVTPPTDIIIFTHQPAMMRIKMKQGGGEKEKGSEGGREEDVYTPCL
jgi:hypothetical protein